MCTKSTAFYSTFIFFFFNDTATTEIYTLSLHDALPISALESTLSPAPPEPITTPEDTLRRAGISSERQAVYQRRMSSLLAGRGGRPDGAPLPPQEQMRHPGEGPGARPRPHARGGGDPPTPRDKRDSPQ